MQIQSNKVTTKDLKSTPIKVIQTTIKYDQQYCYKPYRTLHNY